MIELNRLRLKGVRLLALITWLGIVTIACGMPFAGSGATPLVLAVLLALFPTLAAWQGRTDRPSLMAIGATMPMFSALLLYQWSGHLMQIDLHMSFFAVIAMLAVLADWRPVLAGAATTAVHHLLLNFVAPDLVFPNGADLGRVVLHAVIVVVETGVLMVLAMQLESFLLAQARATAEKEDLEREAERHRAQEEAEQQLVVDQIAGGLRGLAQGDLSSAIQTPFPPSFETLRIDFNNSVARLRELANTVSQSSAQIQHGTAEIQVAADDLARRTELQASSIERTLRTLTDLSASASDAAGRSEAADNALAGSRSHAEKGQEVVAQAVEAMHAIERSSSEIANFLTLIDGIAFQTNLLALNAGVEAARAGDAGKGFAVVANEVRALAQRSADAAKEIASVIKASEAQVGRGVASVTQTGAVLTQLIGEVRSVSDLVREIALAAGNNAAELDKVRGTFVEVDRSTQQNAAMVEESNAALRNLASEARTLMAAVERFGGRTGESLVALAA